MGLSDVAGGLGLIVDFTSGQSVEYLNIKVKLIASCL